MKKKYNSPEIEIIELYTSSMILELSLVQGDDGEGDDGGRGNSTGQKGNEFRGDWSNIWENM